LQRTATCPGSRWPSLGRSAFLTLALSAAATAPCSAQGYQPYLEVKRSEGGYTVVAEGTGLPQVLDALAKEAGFTVKDSGAERQPIQLFEVHDVPLDVTLRKLLVNENHLILYRRGPDGERGEEIEKVILMSPMAKADAGGKHEKPQQGGGGSSLAGPGAIRPIPRGGEPPTPEQQQQQLQQGQTALTTPFGVPHTADPSIPSRLPASPEELMMQNQAQDYERAMMEQRMAVEGGAPPFFDPQLQPPLPPGVAEQLQYPSTTSTLEFAPGQ
jgi:hypothetical protein